jgi:hypothetical protein
MDAKLKKKTPCSRDIITYDFYTKVFTRPCVQFVPVLEKKP